MFTVHELSSPPIIEEKIIPLQPGVEEQNLFPLQQHDKEATVLQSSEERVSSTLLNVEKITTNRHAEQLIPSEQNNKKVFKLILFEIFV